MDITQDIRPLTEFKRDTPRFVAHLRETGRPAVLTVKGKPALVVMDAEVWQHAQEQLEYAQAVSGARQGLAQALEGRGAEAAALFDQLAAREE